MRSQTIKHAVILLFLCAFSCKAEASQHVWEGDAFAHCQAVISSWQPAHSSQMKCETQCQQSGNSFISRVSYTSTAQNCNPALLNWASVEGHPYTSDCSAKPDLTDLITHVDMAPLICTDNCQYANTGPETIVGILSYSTWSPVGTACVTTGPQPEETPDSCEVLEDRVVCDCAQDPTGPICPGSPNEPPPQNCISTEFGTRACYTGPQDPDVDDDPNNNTDPDDDDDNNDDDGNDNGNDNGNGNDDGNQDPDTGEECLENNEGECIEGGGSWGDGEGTGSAGTSDTCETPPTCSGNAVQCAIVDQVWRSNCMLMDTKGNKAPWEGGDAAWGRDLKTEADTYNVFTDSSDPLNADGFAGGGNCPAEPQFSVFGTTITIPTVHLCEFAAMAKPFVIIMALITGLVIIGRAF